MIYHYQNIFLKMSYIHLDMELRKIYYTNPQLKLLVMQLMIDSKRATINLNSKEVTLFQYMAKEVLMILS